ncbi:hypothetical protein [Flavobacterium johnsoniae]|uniref:hypothetical protein n=1 Tax=Flavobacterium johnsoniae TaxID=986 RepID=UPI000F4E9A4B|nr:hypothetical protein [Flavobacterium johnsoniae]
MQQLHFKAVSFGIDWAAYCSAELIQISRRGPQALAYLFCSLQAESFQPFLLSVGIQLCKKRLLLMVFYSIKSVCIKISLGRFGIARCTICFILGQFILMKLVIFRFPNFEFPLYGIILFGRYGLKFVAFSLIAFLGIPIGLGPLPWVIPYKVLFYVLHRYVFGAALGFLLRVLRVIGAGCFWLRVLGL